MSWRLCCSLFASSWSLTSGVTRAQDGIRNSIKKRSKIHWRNTICDMFIYQNSAEEEKQIQIPKIQCGAMMHSEDTRIIWRRTLSKKRLNNCNGWLTNMRPRICAPKLSGGAAIAH